jgi:hypothetical protein
MKISRYEFIKYVFIFAIIYTIPLVYVLINKISQIVSLPPSVDIGITLFSGTLISVMCFLMLRFNPQSEKLKTLFIGGKIIVLSAVGGILGAVLIAYLLFNVFLPIWASGL